MYAVFESGGKQHRVEKGDVVKLEKIEAQPGSRLEFENVLLVGEGEGVKIGQPYLSGSKVVAEVLEHGRDKKIRIIKFRRRKHHRKQMGHRQWYTAVRVTDISQ